MRQGAERTYRKTRDVVHGMLKSAEGTAQFADILFDCVVVFELNCARYCLGQITGQDLID